jgi:hypothetical protein
MKSYLLVFLASTLLASCAYDNFQDAYGDQIADCDTSAVSYSLDIQPVIDNNCVNCHGPINPLAGLDISTYQQVDANKGKISDRINRQPGDPLLMPQNGPPLLRCDIDQFDAWVNQGALNN